MGLNLEIGKQSFESLLQQMESPTKLRFVLWLDEKLAEFKVQGFMNFTEEHVPQWLKNYSKSMAKIGLSPTGEAIKNRVVTSVHADKHKSTTKQEANGEIKALLKQKKLVETSTIEKEEADVSKNVPFCVKTELGVNNDDDIIMVLPEEVADNDADVYDQTGLTDTQQIRSTGYSIQQRSAKYLKPPYKYAPKNSFAAAVAARKRRLKPLSQPQNTQNHPAATAIHDSLLVEQRATGVPSHNKHIITEQSIYPSSEPFLSNNSFVETQPSSLTEQLTTYTDDAFLQYPSGSIDAAQVKTEQYYDEGDTSRSFNDETMSDDQVGLSRTFDSTYEEGTSGDVSGGTEMHDTWFPYGEIIPNNSFDNPQVKARKFHQCEMCNLRCSSHSGLQQHRRIHTGERPHSCTLCESTFVRRYHLKSHYLRFHKISNSDIPLYIPNFIAKRK